MDPTEYEIQVARLFEEISPHVENLRVTHQDTIGPWRFDFTIRYELGGMEFLVCDEASDTLVDREGRAGVPALPDAGRPATELFPAAGQPAHDVIDPGARGGRTDETYAGLAEIMASGLP
jgi:hypothetical protein